MAVEATKAAPRMQRRNSWARARGLVKAVTALAKGSKNSYTTPQQGIYFSLRKPSRLRNEKDLAIIEEIFRKVSFLERAPAPLILHLSKVAQFQQAAANDVIMQEGSESDAVFVVITGILMVSKKHVYDSKEGGDTATIQLGHVSDYSFVGESSFFDIRRSATVTSAAYSEILRIDKRDISEEFRDYFLAFQKQKVDFLRTCPLFRDLDLESIEKLARALAQVNYPHNKVVVKQDAEMDEIYIVRKGHLRVVKSMNIEEHENKVTGTLSYSVTPNTTPPGSKGTSPLHNLSHLQSGGMRHMSAPNVMDTKHSKDVGFSSLGHINTAARQMGLGRVSEGIEEASTPKLRRCSSDHGPFTPRMGGEEAGGAAAAFFDDWTVEGGNQSAARDRSDGNDDAPPPLRPGLMRAPTIKEESEALEEIFAAENDEGGSGGSTPRGGEGDREGGKLRSMHHTLWEKLGGGDLFRAVARGINAATALRDVAVNVHKEKERERTKIHMEVSVLGPGEVYGEIPKRGAKRWVKTFSGYTIISTSVTQLYVLKRQDAYSVLDEGTIRALHDLMGEYTSECEAFRSVQQLHKWKSYKHQLVKDTYSHAAHKMEGANFEPEHIVSPQGVAAGIAMQNPHKHQQLVPVPPHSRRVSGVTGKSSRGTRFVSDSALLARAEGAKVSVPMPSHLEWGANAPAELQLAMEKAAMEKAEGRKGVQHGGEGELPAPGGSSGGRSRRMKRHTSDGIRDLAPRPPLSESPRPGRGGMRPCASGSRLGPAAPNHELLDGSNLVALSPWDVKDSHEQGSMSGDLSRHGHGALRPGKSWEGTPRHGTPRHGTPRHANSPAPHTPRVGSHPVKRPGRSKDAVGADEHAMRLRAHREKLAGGNGSGSTGHVALPAVSKKAVRASQI